MTNMKGHATVSTDEQTTRGSIWTDEELWGDIDDALAVDWSLRPADADARVRNAMASFTANGHSGPFFGSWNPRGLECGACGVASAFSVVPRHPCDEAAFRETERLRYLGDDYDMSPPEVERHLNSLDSMRRVMCQVSRAADQEVA